MSFHKDILIVDPEAETNRIIGFLQNQMASFRRDGIVLGLSGGIDSALCAEFCVRALGRDKILGLILPEKESNPVSKEFALLQAKKLGIETEIIEITSLLEAFNTYGKRDKFVKKVFPEYKNHNKIKITLPSNLLTKDSFNFFTLTVDDGKGNLQSKRLNKERLNGIVAATNTKQRARLMNLYYYAERRNYLVCGTTNRTEMLQGFFVKYGDGGVDMEPIAHLYKTQVFQLAEHLEVIKKIRDRIPGPDTYSCDVSDEEFFFRIPFDNLDLLLYAWENKIPLEEISKTMNLTEQQVNRVFRDFQSKYRASKHLRMLPPSLLRIQI